jgi:hypothetical protein
MTEEKVKENRIRRTADRRGFRLLKSRARDQRAIGYGGFMLVDKFTNAVVLGANPYAYAATIDDVESFLDL